jgi:membrane protease YdiL (CAAX protease family)
MTDDSGDRLGADGRVGRQDYNDEPDPARSNSESFRRIAHPLHTIILLAAEGVMAVRASMQAQQMRTAVDLNRVRMYERTMLTEWIGFAFVLFGVWLAGSGFATVLGERWRSVRDILRDVGLGVAFSIISTIVLSMLEPHHGGGADRAVQFLLPHGSLEMTLWVALSVSAGICEEAIYRGYLQRQFMALTKNVPAGILLSGVAFGLAHSYQGLRWAIVIGLEGAMLGAMAHWRKSVRPGMIAHAWKDALAPVLMSAMKH